MIYIYNNNNNNNNKYNNNNKMYINKDIIHKIRIWKSLLGSYYIAHSDDIISFRDFMGIGISHVENCNLHLNYV